MYQVLARKWRPKNFHQLVGQTHVAQALTYALDNNRIHHAYLFTGTRGVGKTTIARIFAKSLNCAHNQVSSNPCGECHHCREIDQGNFPDLIEVDAASRTGVDDTRELLDNVPYAPVKGRYKVYLIDEVHMFSKSSFNALLKTLEEPPAHVKFILATTDPQKLPATILSRCLQFHLKNMSEQQIAGHLAFILQQENALYETEALQLLANAAAGSMRDSLSLLDQALVYGQGKITTHDVATLLGAVSTPQLLNLLEALIQYDAQAVRGILHTLDEYSPDYSALLQSLLQCLQKITIVQLNAQRPEDFIPEQLQSIALRAPIELVQLWYQIATHTWQDLPHQPDAKMALEMGLLRMIALQPIMATANADQIPIIPEVKTVEAPADLSQIVQNLRAETENSPAKDSPPWESDGGVADYSAETAPNPATNPPAQKPAETISSPQSASDIAKLPAGIHSNPAANPPAQKPAENIPSPQSASGVSEHPAGIHSNPAMNPPAEKPAENIPSQQPASDITKHSAGIHSNPAMNPPAQKPAENIPSPQSANDIGEPRAGIHSNPAMNPPVQKPAENIPSPQSASDVAELPAEIIPNPAPPPPAPEPAEYIPPPQLENEIPYNDIPPLENYEDCFADTDTPPWQDEPFPVMDDVDDNQISPTENTRGGEPPKKSPAPQTGIEESATQWIHSFEDWVAFIKTLSLNSFPLMLLENSCPHDWHFPILSFYFDEDAESFKTLQNIAQIETAIGERFQTTITTKWQSQDNVYTPKRYYRDQEDLTLQAATENFLNHPHVQYAKAAFGNDLRIDNIQSTK